MELTFMHVGVAPVAICSRATSGRTRLFACTEAPDHNSPKRKRGRPKGSKNKAKKRTTRVSSAQGTSISNETESNGGYEASFAANFHLLLPLLSKPPLSPRDDEDVDEDTRAMRKLVATLSDRMVSSHRRTPQDENLRPFKTRNSLLRVCATCSGVGEVHCGYCEGVGFLDLGENCEKFVDSFEGWTLAPPKRAVGSYFHCPLCGGRCKTRCEKCMGTGKANGWFQPANSIDNNINRQPTEDSTTSTSTAQPTASNLASGKRRRGRPRFAARLGAGDSATEPFDLEAFLSEHSDRIEITKDNMIILRAQKRRQRRPSTQAIQPPPTQTPPEPAATSLEHGHGRPHKGRKDDDPPSGRRSAPRRSTDFLNTTDFQVGRRLSAPSQQPSSDSS